VTRFWRQLLPAYLFTKPVFIGTYLWSLLIHFLDPINRNSGNPLLRIIVVTTLHIGVFATLYLFKRILLDRVKPGLVPSLTLATLALVGLSRGYFLEHWLSAWDISAFNDVGLRMQISLLTTVSTFSVGIVTTANSRMHQIKSGQLLNELDRLEKVKADALAGIEMMSIEAVEGIKNQLRTYVQSMRGKPVSEILLILRTMIDSVVQPISRQLEVQAINWSPPLSREDKIQVNWIKAFKNGLNPGKIKYRLIPFLMIITALPVVIQNTPFLQAFFPLLLAYCAGFLIGRLFSIIFAGKTVNVGVYLFASLCTGFAMGVCTVPMTQNYDQPYRFLILATLTYPITASLVSMISSADAQLVIATKELAKATEELEWNVARIRETHHQNQRNLARALHGSVQARLASAYLALEKVNQEKVHNPERVNQILEEIQRSVETLSGHQPGNIDLRKLLAQTQENWASIASVTHQISEEDLVLIHRDALSLVAMNDAIPELVFNAIKHGKANAIEISLGFKNERVVELIVQDNGIHELTNVGSGLGTKILNDSAISWNRERINGHTLTTAEFAYSLEKALPS
jgi:signal transduction histidine kinase